MPAIYPSPLHELHENLWSDTLRRFTLRALDTHAGHPLLCLLAADHETFEDRLLQPDWPFYEQHLQRPAPAALRELYADPAWITATLLVYSEACTLNSFEPLDAHYEHPLLAEMKLDVIPFATSEYGDPIYLKPGDLESDAVYLTHHDGGDTEVLADSVAEFVT